MRHGSPTSKSGPRFRLAPFDFVWAFVAPALALSLRDPGLLEPGDFPYSFRPGYVYALVTTTAAITTFMLFRINEGMSRFFSVDDVLTTCIAVATAVASSSVILFVLNRLDGVPRSTPVICGLVMGAGLLLARLFARILHSEEWPLDSRPATTLSPRRILLIGVDRFAAIAIKLIDNQRPCTTEVVAALDPRQAFVGRKFRGVKIVGELDDLAAVIDEYSVHGVEIDEVWSNHNVVAHSPAAHARMTALCASRGLRLVGLAEALNLTPAIDTGPGVEYRGHHPSPSPYFEAKRILDIVMASLLLIIFAPLGVVVACVTLIDVGAPALFWQWRVGLHGQKFRLYKIRTYRAPFNGHGDRVPEERRLSRVGRIIRATRLDEIPQLLNVLVGDMSLIGPRPLLPQDQPIDPSFRLSVRPGITGWAQIKGGCAVTPEDKDALDAWYVRNASLMLDLRILVGTLFFLITGEKLNLAAIEEANRSRATDSAPSEPRHAKKAA